jgi:uncharacterized alkaline shock family protein YloU
MTVTKYVGLAAISDGGKAYMSDKSFAQIATCVLQDMPNVSFEQKPKDASVVNVIIAKPVLADVDKNTPSIDIHVCIRHDENASTLAANIQHEVKEQLLAMAEIPNCSVNVRIDGIF